MNDFRRKIKPKQSKAVFLQNVILRRIYSSFQSDDFPSRKFYIVIVVLVNDERCKSGNNNENPFRNDDIFRGILYCFLNMGFE